MLAGASPVLGDAAEAQDLVDALMAKMEVLALLEEHVQKLENVLGTLDVNASGTNAIRSQAFVYTTTPDAALLDTYMRLATFGELATDPDATKYLDAAGALLAGGVVLATAAGAKKFASFYGEVGGMLFAYQKAAEGFANLLPSEFTAFTFEVTDDSFWEDGDPASGRWQNAQVYAKSKGWDLDKLILEMMLNWAGHEVSGGVNTHAWLQKFTSNEVFLEVVGHTDDFFTGVLTTEVIDKTVGDSDFVEIEPRVFGPTDIGAQEWSERYFLGSGSARFMFIDHFSYEAVETGIATLEIITEPGKFGYKQIKQHRELQMLPIEVTVTPSKVSVTPGETVTFQADVQNANDKRVQWSIEPAGVHTLEVSGDDSDVVSVTTSENPAALPAVLKATSISATGLREDGTPERYGTATLSPKEIIVKPERPCVKPDQQQQFTAEYPEPAIFGQAAGILPQQDAKVLWEATAGRITQDGLFTAPGNPGTVTVTARDPDDPTLFGGAIVEVGDCVWQMTISGSAHDGSYTGEVAVASWLSEGQPVILTFATEEVADLEKPQVYANLLTEELTDFAPGTYFLNGNSPGVIVVSQTSKAVEWRAGNGTNTTQVGCNMTTWTEPPLPRVTFIDASESEAVGTIEGSVYRMETIGCTDPNGQPFPGVKPEIASLRIEFTASRSVATAPTQSGVATPR